MVTGPIDNDLKVAAISFNLKSFSLATIRTSHFWTFTPIKLFCASNCLTFTVLAREGILVNKKNVTSIHIYSPDII